MKKSLHELRKLVEPFLLNMYKVPDSTRFEVEWVDPKILLTPQRLDLVIKYTYIESRENNYDTKFFFDMYKAHIRSFSHGTFSEPGNPDKNSFDAYLKDFHEIIDKVKKKGLNDKISLIPVNENNVIINGSHRVAAAIYFNKKVPIVRLPQIPVDYGAFFFQNMKLETEYVDYATANLIKMLNRPNLHVALLWCRANNPDKVFQAEKILAEETDLIYAKFFPAQYNFVRNLIITAYYGCANDQWLGRPENNFIGADLKAMNCYAKDSILRAYFFYKQNSSDIIQLKKKIRNIFQIGNDSIHITDTKIEAEKFTKILLNRNSVDLMKYGSPYKYFDLIPRLEKFRQSVGMSSENYIIDSSSILGLYGLRAVGDIDYIPLQKSENNLGGGGDNNLKYLIYYESSADDLILNPENYLYFNDMKFISLQRLKLLKKNRRETDRGKDLMDILLTEQIFNKQVESVNKAVMNFISYSHSSRTLNFMEFMTYMELIFFQEGWRTNNLNDEKNILVICTADEDDILKVNNFLKSIRAENSLSKITFIANLQSQTLISNLKHVDKIFTLDQSYSEDIFWQLCKIIELCRDNLWKERFSLCYIPCFDKEFRNSSLLAYISGSFKRIGNVENFTTVPEELKNFANLLTDITEKSDMKTLRMV